MIRSWSESHLRLVQSLQVELPIRNHVISQSLCIGPGGKPLRASPSRLLACRWLVHGVALCQMTQPAPGNENITQHSLIDTD